MIVLYHLTKTYGDRCVLRDVSATFESGHIYGLVGANGCGKTTLMRCVCGFSRPTSGCVVVDGCLIGGRAAVRRAKACGAEFDAAADFAPRTGAIIESPGFLAHETGLHNLMLLASMSGGADKARVRRAMQEMGLDPDEKKPVGKYSLGMRQRLGFAQALMEDPDTLILDEPFNAMDKASMEEVHALLQGFKAKGRTILLASHSAADIEKACDVVFEMREGALVPA